MLFLIMSSGQAATEMYKWVDENGITHYSQLPPPNDSAQVIEKNYTQDADEIKKLEQVRKKKMGEFNTRHQERLDKKKKTRQDKADTKKLQQACEKARTKLKNLSAGRQVKKEVGDEYTIMTDEQRKKDIAELNKKIKEQCL